MKHHLQRSSEESFASTVFFAPGVALFRFFRFTKREFRDLLIKLCRGHREEGIRRRVVARNSNILLLFLASFRSLFSPPSLYSYLRLSLSPRYIQMSHGRNYLRFILLPGNWGLDHFQEIEGSAFLILNDRVVACRQTESPII